MKTAKELNIEILNITMRIRSDYPELTKHIKEMPLNSINNSSEGVEANVLSEYYESLRKLLDEYSRTHLSASESE